MPFRHTEIVAQAELVEHGREAIIYGDVLDALDRRDYAPTANAAGPEDARMRRKVLSWLAPGMPGAPLQVLFAVLELEVRGLSAQATNKILAELLTLTNISHEYGRARRWVRYKLGRRPLELSCLLLPKHDRTKTHQPYQTGFNPTRPIFSPTVPTGQNWWDTWGGAPGVPILCSVLRINGETVLILEAREEVTRADRMRLVCQLLGIRIGNSPADSLLLRVLPGTREMLASDIAYVRSRTTEDRTTLTVRPHITELSHLPWNLAEMTAVDSYDLSLGDVSAFYQSFSKTVPRGLFAAPGEYEVQKAFVVLRGSSSEPLEMRSEEELPGRLRDNLVRVPGSDPNLDQVLKPIGSWPSVERVYLDGSDESYVHIADQIAAACKVDPSSRASLTSCVVSALGAGQGVNIWVPEATLANWLGDRQFCLALEVPGRTANFFVYSVAQTSGSQTTADMGRLAASAAPDRFIHYYLYPTPLDRSIAMFEDRSPMEEMEPGQPGYESLLDVLARLFGSGLGSAASAKKSVASAPSGKMKRRKLL